MNEVPTSLDHPSTLVLGLSRMQRHVWQQISTPPTSMLLQARHLGVVVFHQGWNKKRITLKLNRNWICKMKSKWFFRPLERAGFFLPNFFVILHNAAWVLFGVEAPFASCTGSWRLHLSTPFRSHLWCSYLKPFFLRLPSVSRHWKRGLKLWGLWYCWWFRNPKANYVGCVFKPP